MGLSRVEFKATLRIGGDSLEPAGITRLLEMEPTYAHAKGSPRTSRSKKGKELDHGPWGNGIWGLESGVPRDKPLEEHLRALVDRLEPKGAVLKALRDRGFSMDVFCGCFFPSIVGGLGLNPELLERLGRLGLELQFDIYASLGDR